jgi:hypothetical protein
LKIASFSSSRGALTRAFETIGPTLQNEILRRLKTHQQSTPAVDRLMVPEVAGPDQGQIHAQVRSLALPVLAKYDALLALLHDAEFMARMDLLEPDITTWLGHRSFQKILQHRSQMIDGAIRLAQALRDVLDVLESGNHQTVADVSGTLEAIESYKLHEAGGL